MCSLCIFVLINRCVGNFYILVGILLVGAYRWSSAAEQLLEAAPGSGRPSKKNERKKVAAVVKLMNEEKDIVFEDTFRSELPATENDFFNARHQGLLRAWRVWHGSRGRSRIRLECKAFGGISFVSLCTISYSWIVVLALFGASTFSIVREPGGYRWDIDGILQMSNSQQQGQPDHGKTAR